MFWSKPRRRFELPAYAEAALRASDKLEPVERFHAPRMMIEMVEPVRFQHPTISGALEWRPSEHAKVA